VIAEIERDGVFDAPVVTEVAPFTVFYPAEEYHQDYFRRNPGQGYCRAVIAPKVAKFRKEHLERLKAL
jgi:peptide-methionine (S)-S-oxide reductase